MATNTGSLTALLDPGYRDVFFQWLREHPPEYPKLFNVLDSARAYEEDMVVAGLGSVPEKPEGTNVFYDDPIQGNAVRYTHITYALGFRVTREMYDDDLYRVVKGVVTALARSARHTLETIAWDVLNNHTTAAWQGQDGVCLVSTAHTMLDGSSQSNRSATDADLSVTGLQNAIDAFERQEDHRSLPVALFAKWLVVPPELKWKARELLGSEYRPDTGDNAINAIQGEDMQMAMSHYLDSTTAWWVMSDKGEHDLKVFIRNAVEFSSADDFDSGDMKSKVRFRASAGHTRWQGVWGSPGGGG
jgi:phage major head subunit gpT-like protein